MTFEALIPKLIRASLDGDMQAIRSVAMRIVRQIKSSHPQAAKEIAEALDLHGVGVSTMRSVGIDTSPLDVESRLSLAVVEEPVECASPFFPTSVQSILSNFIAERESATKLLAVGLNPPSSLLLVGPPGVGKTHVARYLSGVFGLKLVTLDLANSISSYLGKTGQNIKNIFNYARNEPSLLFLDEFDAVAKKRDDMSDLGELKRIVNVLLKEMEDWPSHSILIAATNHPELLDKAIWRRFDRVLEIGLPGDEERLRILSDQFSNYPVLQLLNSLLPLFSYLTDGFSGSDLCMLADRVKRKSILSDENPIKMMIVEIASIRHDTSIAFNKKLCKAAKEYTDLSQREMAELIGKSHGAVQNYLRRNK